MLNKLCYVGIGVGSFLIGVATGLGLSRDNCNGCASCDVSGRCYGENEEFDYVDTDSDDHDPWVLDERKERAAQVVAAEMSHGKSNKEKHEALEQAREALSEHDKYAELVDVYASEQDDVDPIHVISQEEYNADEDYEKKDLVYFDIDDVVSDDMDNVIHEWDDLVGEDALKQFGEKSGDEDIVYIRNHNLKSDYMLVREHQSYEENVLGYTNDSEKRVQEAMEFFNNMKKE